MSPRRSSRRRRTTSTDNTVPSSHSVADCLFDLGVTAQDLADCESVNDEFQVIKSAYFAKILVQHPDKGGDAVAFRTTRAAFDVLRHLKPTIASFASHLKDDTTFENLYNSLFQHDEQGQVPSYEYFYEAAQETVPGYKVELAKSGRSQCVKCKQAGTRPRKKARMEDYDEPNEMSLMTTTTTTVVIAKNYIEEGSIRVGSLDQTSGSYGRWHHLSCWRVPYRIWAGLTDPTNLDLVLHDLLRMDEVLLTNLSSLDLEDQRIVSKHVMDRSHWARKTKASKPPPDLRPVAVAATAAAASTSIQLVTKSTTPKAKSTSALAIKTKKHFVIPRPGVGTAIPNRLQGLRFVLTGVFPEVGGGMGLNLGKERVRSMIESFGGIVTSAVSGKTNYLVVGKAPGQSKVSKARERGIPMVGLATLQSHILGAIPSLDGSKPPAIKSFSEGYQGRYIAN